MQRILSGYLSVLLLLGSCFGLPAQEVETADDSLLVKVGPGFDASTLPDGWTIERAGASGWTKLIIDEPKGQAMRAAQAIEGLEVRYNPVVSIPPQPHQPVGILPTDPRVDELWGMEKIRAWESGTPVESPSVVVAIIDTGVDLDHEDLAANIWTNAGEIPRNGIDDDGNGYVDDVHGWDFVSEDNDPNDDNNHGTHVSGTIGAVANNEGAVAGVSWRVQIMPCKFLSAQGGGTLADAIQAVDYAAANGARISNNSWGGSAPANHPAWQPLKEAIELAGTKGHLFVASAGNSNTDNDNAPVVNLPASWDSPCILSVAASDAEDRKASFSSFGRRTVDVAAPGVSILSSTIGNQYQAFSGTSMAAPHVSGLAALLAEQHTDWGFVELKKHIMATVDRSSTWQSLVASGGRINVNRAFREEPPPPPPDDNRPPVAVDDAYETKKNRPILRNPPGLLENDTDPDGDQLSAKLTRDPKHGNVDVISPGGFIYRPDRDFVGTDEFGYQASDGQLTNEATVTIKVTGDKPNRPPVAEPDESIGPGPLVGNVLENDSDPDGDHLTASLSAEPSHGELDFDPRNGDYRYVPDDGFVGQDGFAYKAVDEHGAASDTTPVALKITKDDGDDTIERVIELLEEAIELLRTEER